MTPHRVRVASAVLSAARAAHGPDHPASVTLEPLAPVPEHGVAIVVQGTTTILVHDDKVAAADLVVVVGAAVRVQAGTAAARGNLCA